MKWSKLASGLGEDRTVTDPQSDAYASTVAAHTASERPGRILVADDDPAIARMLERVLGKAGHEVVCVRDGTKAFDAFRREAFDVVVTDLSMPETDGMRLLTQIREHDADVPVIVFTGAPDTQSAILAVNLRATRYLNKPLGPEAIRSEVEDALTLGRLARARREARSLSDRPPPPHSDRVPVDDQSERFDDALRELHMAYQPIVRWSERTVFGFEGLVRTREKSIPHPGVLFDTAERLDRLRDLSRRIRAVVGEPFLERGETSALFVNLHTRDLLDDDLYVAETPLARLADRVVLEITERASLNVVADLDHRVARLRSLGYRIAVDDIGAGYSGLNSFALLRPNIVKLDLSLVRNVDREPLKQRLVRMLCEMSADLGIEVVGEGVETVQERDALSELGCDLLQGYLFARPGPAFPVPEYGT